MHCLSFFAVLALVLGSTQTMASGDEAGAAECNSIGCVRPTNAVEDLAKTTVHTLSAIRVHRAGQCAGLMRHRPLRDRAGGNTTAEKVWERWLRDA